ncbi:MAG: hypothetical protein AAB443_01260 [Patescibacteria group bacterium]
MKLRLLAALITVTITIVMFPGASYAKEGSDAQDSTESTKPAPPSWKEKLKNFLDLRKQKKDEYQQNKENFKQEKKELKEQFVENKCDVATKRIDTKINAFDQNKARHIERYNLLKDKIKNFIDRAKAKGLNTSKLEADLATLDEKIKKFATDYANYIKELRDTKAFACGNSEGQFKQALSEAREAMKKVHEDAKDIRHFYTQTIKEDLKALRQQLKNTTTE